MPDDRERQLRIESSRSWPVRRVDHNRIGWQRYRQLV
jgi:hypothetical protein